MKKAAEGCLFVATACCNFGASSGSVRLGAAEIAVFLTEAFNATGGINDLLLAGIEGVAGGTHFNVQTGPADGRAGDEAVATRAGDGDFFVLGMDVGFHVDPDAGGGCDRPDRDEEPWIIVECTHSGKCGDNARRAIAFILKRGCFASVACANGRAGG
jgi:hypothetical protein